MYFDLHWIRFNLELACAPFFLVPFVLFVHLISIYSLYQFMLSRLCVLFFLSFRFTLFIHFVVVVGRRRVIRFWKWVCVRSTESCSNFHRSIVDSLQNIQPIHEHSNWQNKEIMSNNRKPETTTEIVNEHKKKKLSRIKRKIRKSKISRFERELQCALCSISQICVFSFSAKNKSQRPNFDCKEFEKPSLIIRFAQGSFLFSYWPN